MPLVQRTTKDWRRRGFGALSAEYGADGSAAIALPGMTSRTGDSAAVAQHPVTVVNEDLPGCRRVKLSAHAASFVDHDRCFGNT